ncbi:MAG: hypothetical protein L3J39_05980 [Verrucomicrobiales bacterium]|nr:hypothetical protein [Verrucomicrobiales bacterium]
MKRSIPFFFIVASAMIGLSSCVTSPTASQMRRANSSLKQSAKMAKQGDYSGARTAAAVVGRSVHTGIELAPIVTSKTGQKVNLKPMLTSWESGPYQDLKTALKGKQQKAATIAFTNLRGQCTNCHSAIGRPNIHLN